MNERGISLVEIIVAVSIFVVVALASATLYATVIKVNLKDKLTQDLQREGDEVMAHMSRTLKEATRVDTANSNLTTNPNSLRVFLKSGAARRYYVAGNQVHYVAETGTDENLMAPGSSVTTLTFTPTSDGQDLKSVNVSATLSRTQNQQTVTLTVGTTVNTRPQ